MDAEFRKLFIEMLEQMAEQGKQIAAQNEKLVEQGEQIAMQNEKLAAHNEKFVEQGKQIATQNNQLIKHSKDIKNALRQLGNVQNNQGILVESLIGESMIKFMTDIDKGAFEKVIHNMWFKFKESTSDIDSLFMFSKAIVLIDAKSIYKTPHLDKWDTELLPSLLADPTFQRIVDGRKIYAGVAGLRFKSKVVERASELGYYAFRLLNENAKLLNGEGFEARAVG